MVMAMVGVSAAISFDLVAALGMPSLGGEPPPLVATGMGSTAGDVSLVVIAVAALAIAAYQGIELRRHNRLSVRPILSMDTNLTKGVLTLRNKGFGPALVSEVRVAIEDAPLQRATLEVWGDISRALGGGRFTCTVGKDEKVLGPDEALDLFAWEPPPQVPSVNPGRDLARLHVVVEYESLYHAKDTCVLRPMDSAETR